MTSIGLYDTTDPLREIIADSCDTSVSSLFYEQMSLSELISWHTLGFSTFSSIMS